MAASTASNALTRIRRKSVASSASNIEALPGEGNERVLERGADGGEASHADAGHDELAIAVLGSVPVEAGEHGRALDAEVGETETREDLRGARGVVGLDAELRPSGGLELGERALGKELAEGHHGHVRADLLDLREQVAGKKDG